MTHNSIGLEYDLRMKVINAGQFGIAEFAAAEKKTISGSFRDPPAAAKEQIPLAFKQVLEKLLSDPGIIAALQQ
jgi:hypothetical protein